MIGLGYSIFLSSSSCFLLLLASAGFLNLATRPQGIKSGFRNSQTLRIVLCHDFCGVYHFIDFGFFFLCQPGGLVCGLFTFQLADGALYLPLLLGGS